MFAVNHQKLALVTDVAAVLPERSKTITVPMPLSLRQAGCWSAANTPSTACVPKPAHPQQLPLIHTESKKTVFCKTEYLLSFFLVIFFQWQVSYYLTNAKWKHTLDSGWSGVIVWIVGARDWYSHCIINLLNCVFLFTIRQLLNIYRAFKMAFQRLPLWTHVWVNICMQVNHITRIHICSLKQKAHLLRDFELIFWNKFSQCFPTFCWDAHWDWWDD